MPQRTSVTIAGSRIQMQRAGTGMPLLFLHGGKGASRWLPFFQDLSTRFDVIVPEHPGFGYSDSPEWLSGVGDLANFYLEFLQLLDLDQVHLVGTSFGGWIASELALRDARRLSSLALIASAGIRLENLEYPDMFLWTPEQGARRSFFDPALAQQALAAQPDEDERRRQTGNLLTLAKLGRASRMSDPTLHRWLHRIALPTLIMWGEGDEVIPPQHAQEFHRLIPGSQLVVLKECGHLPHVEKRSEVVEHLTRFIAGAGVKT